MIILSAYWYIKTENDPFLGVLTLISFSKMPNGEIMIFFLKPHSEVTLKWPGGHIFTLEIYSHMTFQTVYNQIFHQKKSKIGRKYDYNTLPKLLSHRTVKFPILVVFDKLKLFILRN